MIGNRPLSPRQIKQMRGKMKTIELKGVEEVIIRFSDKEIIIPNPEVSKIILAGEMYQVVGQGIERTRGEDSTAPQRKLSEADIRLVMEQTGATEQEAKKALEEENGDLAGAIVRLKTNK